MRVKEATETTAGNIVDLIQQIWVDYCLISQPCALQSEPLSKRSSAAPPYDSESRLLGLSLTWTCVMTSSRFSALCHGARRAKWAGRHFRACQRAGAAPWGAAGAHASEPSSPLATLPLFSLLSSCSSPPSLSVFSLVSDILVVHFLYMASSPLPAAAGLSPAGQAHQIGVHRQQRLHPSQAEATQTLHPHE